MKVVVIDDEVEIGEILSFLLQKEGHQVTVFSDPMEASDAIVQLRPDFIVCDFKMPQMNGLQVFLKIRSQHLGPFVILTGEPSTDPEDLKKQGIKDVLFKPRNLKRVAPMIQDYENSLK